jgi:hypothetical protein
LWLYRRRLHVLRFRILIGNSLLAPGTDCPTADKRDRNQHDGNPTLSAQPVFITGIHAFHVPLSFLLDFSDHRCGDFTKTSDDQCEAFRG